MDRRDFLKKTAMAALDTEGMQTMRTLATNMAFLLQKIHADGHPAPQRDERPQFMNFIR